VASLFCGSLLLRCDTVDVVSAIAVGEVCAISWCNQIAAVGNGVMVCGQSVPL